MFQHINKQHPSIKFAVEKEDEDHKLPTLDLRLKREDNNITTDIYHNPTHTDQYLVWRSNHPIQQKLGTVRTLMHRADTLIADKERRKIEMVRAALRICAYPEWALKEGELRGKRQLRKEEEKGRDQVEDGKSKQYAVLPYTKGVAERLQRAFRKHSIALHAKAGFTIRNAVVSPKDPLDSDEQCGVIYQCACDVCVELYVGETGRSLEERVAKHGRSIERQDSKLALSQYREQSGHRWNMEQQAHHE